MLRWTFQVQLSIRATRGSHESQSVIAGTGRYISAEVLLLLAAYQLLSAYELLVFVAVSNFLMVKEHFSK